MANELSTKLTVSQALAKPAIIELGKNLELTQEQLAKARSSALTLQSSPTLKNCDGLSIVKYCYETARYNFTRDDAIYPVPYGNGVQAQMGYKGFRELAMRSQKYNEISCSAVYDCDKVYRDRDTGSIKVEFNEDINATLKAKVIGYYAYAINKIGQLTNSIYWTKSMCEAHGKKYSKTYDKTWGRDSYMFDKMAKKTVIKQLCSELDQTPELTRALQQDQIVYGADGKTSYEDNPQNVSRKSNISNSIIDAIGDEETQVEDKPKEEVDPSFADLVE